MLHRRQLLQSAPLLLGSVFAPLGAFAQLPAVTTPASGRSVDRLAAGWRTAPDSGVADAGRDFVGILELDWHTRQVHIAAQVLLPQRAHGLQAEPQGGFLAVAARPGRYLLRCDAQGQAMLYHSLDKELPHRTLSGHSTSSADGQWLYTPETDSASGQGWVSVREHATLRKVAEWPSHGIDPHQCLVDPQGALLLVNGGIPRDADGKKRNLDQMAPSLVRLDGTSGALLGRWRLKDPRLSLRHMAWSLEPAPHTAQPVLGIGLQAEHDDPSARHAAPALAVFNGTTLHIPSASTLAGGYAGDIAAGPGGGFILSGQKTKRGLLWHPDAPDALHTVAELSELCALASWHNAGRSTGILMGGARGVARWHPSEPAAMLAWPQAMSPDNHWVLLA